MKEKIKNKYGLMKVLLVVLVVIIIGVIYSCSNDNKTSDSQNDVSLPSTGSVVMESSDMTSENETEAETTEKITICVHVCGAVVSPGVYFLDEGSRIHQAVELAGGMTEDAADDYINLASVVTDGVQIYIPTVAEVESGNLPLTSMEESTAVDDGLVDINTATVEELMTLPGIGESKAEAIITYRENVAPFETIEDITNVDGIKDSSYEKIKDYIKVS